ncbi:hypothetical protein PORCRE_1370 [Porphyromonas crevioricanis JCM 15906]|uniref:Uncharacterized protein n=1 Tax=Porphyromonas crevioricanis JCM 15906 TaxID=1305617 RepID=T1DSD1_9PORP|nr:hypothetical protein PORCRE_1370 [Porphyromonas crevioricanis JCM 15906]GAD06551.1 hypothetical protein PORCAN_147 [Porphyromonas crevioricanis JCM 13913]
MGNRNVSKTDDGKEVSLPALIPDERREGQKLIGIQKYRSYHN